MTDQAMLVLARRIIEEQATHRDMQALAAAVVGRLTTERPPLAKSTVDGGLVLTHGQTSGKKPSGIGRGKR